MSGDVCQPPSNIFTPQMVSPGVRCSLKGDKRGWAAEVEGDLCTSAFRGSPCQAAPRVAHSQFPQAQEEITEQKFVLWEQIMEQKCSTECSEDAP